MSKQKLQLRSIRAEDNLNSLSFGNKEHTPLKIFLKKDALNFDQNNIAKTYVLVGEAESLPRVRGYITFWL